MGVGVVEMEMQMKMQMQMQTKIKNKRTKEISQQTTITTPLLRIQQPFRCRRERKNRKAMYTLHKSINPVFAPLVLGRCTSRHHRGFVASRMEGVGCLER